MIVTKTTVVISSAVSALLGGVLARAQEALQGPITLSDALVPIVALTLVGSLVQNWRLSIGVAEIRGRLSGLPEVLTEFRGLQNWSANHGGEIKARWENQDRINDTVAQFKEDTRHALGKLEVGVSGLQRFPDGPPDGQGSDT